MKNSALLLFILVSAKLSAQSSINSASLIAPNAMISIGEIVVNPVNQNQSNSGIIGILAQVNQQQLEVSEFDVTSNIKVFPNPTVAKIYFESNKNLQGEKISIFNNSGQLISKTKIDASNSIDLESLSNGIYLIEFADAKKQSFKIIKKQ